MTMQHYRPYSAFLKQKFGGAVQKISLSSGCSCPNRDGTKGRGGCDFCDNRAFSPSMASTGSPVDQLARALERLSGPGRRFIAYLQPFSNTYAPVDLLARLYDPLVGLPRVVGISIGTRPDCLDGRVCDYLAGLARRTFLSVEIGLQSSHDATLSAINRGHTFGEFRSAVGRLATTGVEIVAHVIIGLPGETPEMIFQTATALASLPVSGVKMHQLMIIAGTRMAERHAAGGVPVLSIGEYAPLLAGFIERLRPDQWVHRIMSDSRYENGLIAPEWSADKNSSLQFLQDYLDRHGVVQGSRFVTDP